MARFFFAIMLCIVWLVAGCGYQFQGRHNPLRDLGVEKIYVEGFRNDSYRPGIEQLFSTSMIREIQKSRSFQLVNTEKEADAVLSGTVSGAESSVSSVGSVLVSPTKPVNVAAEFNVHVACSILLKDRHGRVIFAQTISDNKTYPASTRIGDQGATGPLINESEQRLAIQFLAGQMMASVYQRLVDTF